MIELFFVALAKLAAVTGLGPVGMRCIVEAFPAVRRSRDTGKFFTGSVLNMSDTPRTDAVLPGLTILTTQESRVLLEHARTLERELSAFDDALATAENAYAVAIYHLGLLLPLAKGYAADHRHGTNDRIVSAAVEWLEKAESAGDEKSDHLCNWPAEYCTLCEQSARGGENA